MEKGLGTPGRNANIIVISHLQDRNLEKELGIGI